MDNFMRSHIFCLIQRDSESALLLIGTFKQSSVLQWFSEGLGQHSGSGKQILNGEDAATLYVVTWNPKKSALNQPNTADFNTASLLWAGKSGFATMWVCDRKSVSAVPATQLLTKCWIFNQLSHVNSRFYQDMSSSVWVPPCLLHIKHIWSWGLAQDKVRKEKFLHADTSEGQGWWTLHCGYQLWKESKSENVTYSAMLGDSWGFFRLQQSGCSSELLMGLCGKWTSALNQSQGSVLVAESAVRRLRVRKRLELQTERKTLGSSTVKLLLWHIPRTIFRRSQGRVKPELEDFQEPVFTRC